LWGEDLRRLTLISIDLLFVASATLIAVMLRGYFDTISQSLVALMPYSFISLGCASVIFFVGGLDRTPWRYSSVADHLQVIVLTILAILLALVFTFALNRLEPVARSLPVLQGGLIVSFLIVARSAARYWYTRQLRNNNKNDRANEQPSETVLVMGVNSLTELFLLSVKEFASQRFQVAGIIAEESSMRGRAIQQKPILGTVEELSDVLQALEVHGVAADRIVVTIPQDRIKPHSLQSLLEIEKTWDIAIEFLPERLGLEGEPQGRSVVPGQVRNSAPAQRAVPLVGNVVDASRANFAVKSLHKRLIDALGATLLILAVSPLAILVALIVALDVRFPIIFWQQRPGLYGRPFKLYKFRTMHASHDKQGERIPDDQRSSAIGKLLRRTRLDELPQLLNVLIGDMSLVGPRPLLPCDQAPEYATRLSVRPGITGWAQVNGGRIISTSDKLVLDIWYVQNASLALDLVILLRTARMVLFGDRVDNDAIVQARSNLGLNMAPAE